jgi:xanthine dehydrogenase YagR molybdenum-binding subunit
MPRARSRRPDDLPEWGPRGEHRLLDHDLPRVDGPDKVTGRARYTHDVRLPGMLWGRVLCCPYPVAEPVLDAAAARAIPGVVAVLDMTGELEGATTARLGQVIAAVAAKTPEIAEDALRALNPRYVLGRWAVTQEQAAAEGAPVVNQRGNVSRPRVRAQPDEEGAVDRALAASDVVVEATYTVPVQVHACLETHGVVVDYRGDGEATVYASTQDTFSIPGDAAGLLDLPENKITSVVEHMGGGFGAKFGIDLPGNVACRLAKLAQAPVHLMFSRADEFLSAGNRSGARQSLKGGASKDGTFRALHSTIWKHGGVGGGAHPGQPYIYSVGASRTEMMSVFTHTDGNRAMRAPGHPQASFAIESMVDELAHAIGMDPLEFRKKNLRDPVWHRQLDRVAREIGWLEHPHRLGPPAELALPLIGIGFGISTWGGGGGDPCQVDVRIERDGSVGASCGTQDIGTGTRTYLAAIVAEELGLELGAVRATIGNSKLGFSVGSGGSVTTASLAPAVKDAAHRARLALLAHLSKVLGVELESLVLRDAALFSKGGAERKLTWKEACASLPVEGLAVRGTFQVHLQDSGVHGAQAAKVEVDPLTGETRVLKMVCVQDCGLVMNRLALRSQINGGMIQGLSYGLWEERVIDPDLGLQLNANFEEYKIAGTLDVPEMLAIPDDEDERNAVIGMGEPPVIPGQSAVVNAIFNACGVRIRDLPATRDKIVQGLADRRG